MRALPLRPLGDSGLRVTPLGLGLAALGRPAYMTPDRELDFPEGRSPFQMEQRTHALLDLAWERGLRLFDAARSYGHAEGFLARWLERAHVEPGDGTIGSKWGYVYVGDWQLEAPVHEVKRHDLETLRRQWEASRQLLWNHLDLYQLHSLTPDSPFWDRPELAEALGVLKQTHGVRIGFTASGPRQADTIRRALDIEAGGQRLFDVVQATFNPLEPSVGPVLDRARAAGVGVVVKEALANGRLLQPSTAGFETARGLARDRGVGVDALALAAVLRHPSVDAVLTGAVTKEQLASNLAAFDVDWDDALQDWADSLAEAPEAYWAARSRLAWA